VGQGEDDDRDEEKADHGLDDSVEDVSFQRSPFFPPPGLPFSGDGIGFISFDHEYSDEGLSPDYS
jgi:hypothetical protein